VQLSSGDAHTCAIDSGSAKCWGFEGFGLNLPPSLSGPVTLGSGTFVTCAIDQERIACWGDNTYGQTMVPSNILTIAAHACVIDKGQARCVGGNERGQLGVGNDQNAAVQIALAPQTDLALGPLSDVALGMGFSCALADGVAKCWGRNESGQLGIGDSRDRGNLPGDMGANLPPVALGKIATTRAGRSHACAVTQDGGAYCWGIGTFGRLGLESTANALTPMKAHLRSGLLVKDFALGAAHTCLLSTAGQVFCFGNNSVGQLGAGVGGNIGSTPGSLGQRMVPVNLGAGFVTTKLASGANHVCALSKQGAVKCFGANDLGQLGLGDTQDRGLSPLGDNLHAVDFGHGQIVTDLACGDEHCCVRTSENTMKCWGDNSRGQLGLGDTNARGATPESMGDNLPFVQLPVGESVTELALKSYRTCARSDSGLRCWGANSGGQLGLGDTLDRGASSTSLPRELPTLGI